MVRGLDTFKEFFQGYEDNYILIGGTASTLVMEDAGLPFRATADLDIVLCIESLTPDFVSKFWEFVQAGNYQNRQKSTGERQFYRFYEPENKTYPEMLELFSRQPDALEFDGHGHLTSIPMGDEASSLSAILLDDAYYEFLHAGKQDMDGLSIIGPEYIIPLKARAWLDLTARRDQGDHVDSTDIKKHKNDVFRLFQVISPDIPVEMAARVKDDMARFLMAMETEDIDLKNLRIRGIAVSEILDTLREIYRITGD